MKWLSNIFSKKLTIEQTEAFAKEEKQKIENNYLAELSKLQNNIEPLKEKGVSLINELTKTQTLQTDTDSLLTLSKFLEEIKAPSHERDFHELHTRFKILAGKILPPLKAQRTPQNQALLNYLHELEQYFIRPYTSLKERDKFIHLENLISQFHNIQKQREETNQHKLRLIDSKEQLLLKQHTLKQEKEKLMMDEEFSAIKKELLNRANERKQAEQAIKDLFLTLKPLLLSYAQKSGNTLCKAYAAEPVEALTRDYTFGIAKHYADLYKETISEELHKDLGKLTTQFLGKLVHTFAQAKKKEADFHSKIADLEIMKTYENLSLSIKQNSQEIADIEEEITLLKPPLEKETVEQISSELQNYNIKLFF